MRALVGLLVLLGGCVYRVDPPFDAAVPDGACGGMCGYFAGEACCYHHGPTVCINTLAHAEHCGACGNECTDGTVCRDGTCEAP